MRQMKLKNIKKKLNNYFECVPPKKLKLDNRKEKPPEEKEINTNSKLTRFEILSTSGQSSSTSGINEIILNLSTNEIPTEPLDPETKEMKQLKQKVFSKDFRNFSSLNGTFVSKLNTIIKKYTMLREIADHKRLRGYTSSEKKSQR